LTAATTSFAAGGAFLYFVSVNFVFGFRRISNRAIELPLFLALGVAGLIVNTTVMFVAVEKVHLHYLVAKVAAAGCTFTVNFLLRRNLLFSRLTQPS
jgi:putative flippase GtrA